MTLHSHFLLKEKSVLNGDTVIYASYDSIPATLDYDLTRKNCSLIPD